MTASILIIIALVVVITYGLVQQALHYYTRGLNDGGTSVLKHLINHTNPDEGVSQGLLLALLAAMQANPFKAGDKK